MIIVRPTASLAKRVKIKLQPSSNESTNRLGDWYANDIVLNRRQFILCVSSKSRLAVVIEAAPYAKFPDRLCDAVTEVLKAVNVNSFAIQEERAQMDEMVLAKTVDKSILGTMNEYKFQLEYSERLGRLDLNDTMQMSLSLSKMISLVLPESYPRDAALKLFGQEPSTRPKMILENQIPSERVTPKLYVVK